MARYRCLTAKNALVALLVWLVLALVFHLNAELRHTIPVLTDPLPSSAPKDIQHFSAGGNEPILPSKEGLSSPRANRTAVVVASRESKNATTWLDSHFPPEWEKSVYQVNDGNASMTLPQNKGGEAMVYLTFIIENYDSLSDNILFLHPDRYHWRNDDVDYDIVPMLKRFEFSYLASEGYVNLRCTWSPGCPSAIKPLGVEDDVSIHYKEAFEMLFPEKEVPTKVGGSCCSQFAVTAEKIKERKRDEYVRYRKWLLHTELADEVAGRILEYSWHVIFGKESFHCQPASQCYCKAFGLCGLECEEEGSCAGRYALPSNLTLPSGWPFRDWHGAERNRSHLE